MVEKTGSDGEMSVFVPPETNTPFPPHILSVKLSICLTVKDLVWPRVCVSV